MIIDRPVPFAGSTEEAMENRKTHRWANEYDTVVCIYCDCKWWGETANYPCGVNPPREVVEIGS